MGVSPQQGRCASAWVGYQHLYLWRCIQNRCRTKQLFPPLHWEVWCTALDTEVVGQGAVRMNIYWMLWSDEEYVLFGVWITVPISNVKFLLTSFLIYILTSFPYTLLRTLLLPTQNDFDSYLHVSLDVSISCCCVDSIIQHQLTSLVNAIFPIVWIRKKRSSLLFKILLVNIIKLLVATLFMEMRTSTFIVKHRARQKQKK